METNTETLREKHAQAVQERSALRAEVTRVETLVSDLEQKARRARSDADEARTEQREIRRSALLRGQEPPTDPRPAELQAEADQHEDDAGSLRIERDRLRVELERVESEALEAHGALLRSIRGELERQILESVPAHLAPQLRAVREVLSSPRYQRLKGGEGKAVGLPGRVKLGEVTKDMTIVLPLADDQLGTSNLNDILENS